MEKLSSLSSKRFASSMTDTRWPIPGAGTKTSAFLGVVVSAGAIFGGNGRFSGFSVCYLFWIIVGHYL